MDDPTIPTLAGSFTVTAEIRQGLYAKYRGVDVLLIAAVCDRESRGGDALRPVGPAGTGDEGHGRGLMQIDDRSHPDFLAEMLPNGTPKWQHPAWNLIYGAHHLGACMRHFGDTTLWLRTAALREAAGIASYNCGFGGVMRGTKEVVGRATDEDMLRAIDSKTTGKDYAQDVLRRRQGFEAALRKLEAP